MTLDETDKSLLAALQEDSTLTAEALGERIHRSASQAARRRQRLEQDGLIRGYTARLAPRPLGLTVQAFVQVELTRHGHETSAAFARLVRTTPAITAAWTMTGAADYLLRVWTEDLAALNRLIHDVLLADPVVAKVQSQIVMDQLKQDGPLPL